VFHSFCKGEKKKEKGRGGRQSIEMSVKICEHGGEKEEKEVFNSLLVERWGKKKGSAGSFAPSKSRRRGEDFLFAWSERGAGEGKGGKK